MNSLFSKLSLYDILAQLIPGWVFVCEVLYVLGIPYTSPYVIIGSFAFGYLLGLALHSFGEWLWDVCHFRNNPEAIRDAFYKCKLYDEYSLYNEIHVANDDRLIDIYYKAYYYVCNVRQQGGEIKTMEYHIAFIRSMMLPVILIIPVATKYILCSFFHCCTMTCTLITLLLGVFLIVLFILCKTKLNHDYATKITNNIQRKIYQCVWEDYEYLKRLEETTVCIRTKQTVL